MVAFLLSFLLSPHVLSFLQIKSSAATALCLQVTAAAAAGETRLRTRTPQIRWIRDDEEWTE